MIQINHEAKPYSEGFKVIIPMSKKLSFLHLFRLFPSKSCIVQHYEGALEQLQKMSCGHIPATNLYEF